MVAIVTRAQWGAAFAIPGGRHVAPSARRWFVVHWPGSAVGADERAVVRSIERFHRQNMGWQAAPGYNFLVGRSGTIYEGCGRDVRGIHSPPRNTDGFGVCVLVAPGETPPQAALNATRALYNWLNQVTGRTLGMTWHGQHHPTACAGPALNAWVQRGMPANAPAPPPPPGPGGAPAFPGRVLRQPPIMRGEDVRTWQARVRQRGWNNVVVDGAYGPISEAACRQVQQIARLSVDGRVGPNTWPATWRDNAGPPGAGAGGGGGTTAPPFPGRIMISTRPMMQGADIRTWQQQMRNRTWTIAVDGWYGPESERVCRQFQTNQRLSVDGRVGPITWAASWERPT